VKKKLCHDVSKGLVILHACGITHGDLKHENVLVFRNKVENAEVKYTAKLADFGGSAMDFQEGERRFLPSGGTPPFDAPESHRGLDGEGLKNTDVYSLGILVWRTILDGKNPFKITALSSLTLEQIQQLKAIDALLPIAVHCIRDDEAMQLTNDEKDIIDFVFNNTLKMIPENRSLRNTTAALQVHWRVFGTP
jgi:serine/threonine protein kinase